MLVHGRTASATWREGGHHDLNAMDNGERHEQRTDEYGTGNQEVPQDERPATHLAEPVLCGAQCLPLGGGEVQSFLVEPGGAGGATDQQEARGHERDEEQPSGGCNDLRRVTWRRHGAHPRSAVPIWSTRMTSGTEITGTKNERTGWRGHHATATPTRTNHETKKA